MLIYRKIRSHFTQQKSTIEALRGAGNEKRGVWNQRGTPNNGRVHHANRFGSATNARRGKKERFRDIKETCTVFFAQ